MKKKIIALLMAALIVCLLLPVQSFAAVIVRGAYKGIKMEKELGEIQGASSYAINRNLLPDGLNFKADYHYNSKIEKDILVPVLYGTPTKGGTYEFSVTYYKTVDGDKVKTVTYSVTVSENSPFDYLVGYWDVDDPKLEIVQEPYKTKGYYLNEALDTKGLKVEARGYKDGKEVYIDVTDICTISPTVFVYDEGQDVTVTLSAPNKSKKIIDFTATFRVVDFAYAGANDVISVAVKNQPTKTTYEKGEKLNTEGLVLTVTYGSGATKEITEDITFDVTKLDTVGEQSVIATYKEKTTTFTVNVNEPVVSTVEPVAPVSQPEPIVEEPVVEEPVVEEPVVEEPVSEPEPIVEEPVVEEPVVEEPVETIVEEPEEKSGISFWIWIIIGLLVVALAAVLGLYLLGKKRQDIE